MMMWPVDRLDEIVPSLAAATRKAVASTRAPRMQQKPEPLARYWVVLVDFWYRTPENCIVLVVDSETSTVEQIAYAALDYLFEDTDHLWRLETLGPGARYYLESGEPAISGTSKVDGATIAQPYSFRTDGDKHFRWWLGSQRPGRREDVYGGIPKHLRSNDSDGPARGLFTTNRTALLHFDFGDDWRLVLRTIADLNELPVQLAAPVVIVCATARQHHIRQYPDD
ncbi:hypothetical protein [Mycobacteroides abscessus]|uniref:hypothetical protein n=1 Tax=Mycobacteroides abscessus TaxID=36809 RepID=UPI0009A74598|nr:hypothetical protein [Mycobacteroides abscessus]SLH39151.1 Uncharacterised protein [Mycobacteroides abscessus subsp. massiliense]